MNSAGRMVVDVWSQLPNGYAGVGLDVFVLMPDHFHGIIVLGRGGVPASIGLPDVVHRFKSFTTARYRHSMNLEGWRPYFRRLWHRNYYKRIVRNRQALCAIRRYIADNPHRWKQPLQHLPQL